MGGLLMEYPYPIVSNDAAWSIDLMGVVGMTYECSINELVDFIKDFASDPANEFDYYYVGDNKDLLAKTLADNQIDFASLGTPIVFAIQRVDEGIIPHCFVVVDLEQHSVG